MLFLRSKESRDTQATDSSHETLWIEAHASTISFFLLLRHPFYLGASVKAFDEATMTIIPAPTTRAAMAVETPLLCSESVRPKPFKTYRQLSE